MKCAKTCYGLEFSSIESMYNNTSVLAPAKSPEDSSMKMRTVSGGSHTYIVRY